MIEGIELSYLGEMLFRSAAGWRYLISPGYRALKRAEWKRRGRQKAISDITGGLFGIALTVALVWLLIAGLSA